MLFSRYGALFGLLGGLVEASPAPIHRMGDLIHRGDVSSSAKRTLSPCTFDLGKEWQGETLFKGVAAVATETAAAISLDVSLPEAAVAGSITVDVSDGFLIAPTVRVGLADVKAYVQLALGATAGVFESIELFASEKLSVEIPGLLEIDLGAAFALDLVISVDAAVQVLAGFYVVFPADAYIEINLLTKEIVNTHLEGLTAQSLPIAVGAEVDLSAEIELGLGLRLRAGLELDAGLDIVGLEIGAGADVAIWISLFDYTTVLVQTTECPVSVSETFALDVGIAIEVDIELLDLLELNLAPSIAITLATAPAATVCIPELGGVGVPSNPGGPQIGAGGDDSGDDSSDNSGSGSGSDSGSDAGSDASATGSAAVSATDAVLSSATVSASSYGTGAPISPSSTSGSWNDTGLITSTITSTATYTITSCAASVTNCPASYTQKIVTKVTHVTTTVCPATQTSAGPTAYPTVSTSSSCTVPTPTSPVTMSPCPTPSTSTVVVPTSCPKPVPTITIEDTTTICPATSTLATGTGSGYPSGPAPTTYPGETKPTTTAEAPAPTYPASYPAVTPPASTYQPSASAPAPSAPCSTCLPVEAGVGRVVGGGLMAALPLLAALL